MRLRVEFQDGTIEFDAPEDRVVGRFDGPPESPGGDVLARVRESLEAPIGYPPLRQVVVPGDRVVLAIDPGLPELPAVLGAVAEVLNDVGVASITAIADSKRVELGPIPPIPGVDLVAHDPLDRESMAYLATTESGRRIYLNKLVPDADCVIPIGRILPDGPNDCRGPWSLIEPGLTDSVAAPTPLLAGDPLASEESIEVSWLLGSQFQLGGIAGREGLLHLVCGETRAVRERGSALLDESWRVDLHDRADLVVAGLGGPGRAAGPADLVEGLRQSLRSVRQGGKVALLSRLDLATIREALLGSHLPRGDWEKAQRWADVYLAADAPADELDELGLIPLDRPEQAIKLAASAPSIAAISQVDRARVAHVQDARTGA